MAFILNAESEAVPPPFSQQSCRKCCKDYLFKSANNLFEYAEPLIRIAWNDHEIFSVKEQILIGAIEARGKCLTQSMRCESFPRLVLSVERH